jgi:hypothetical protein
MITEIAIKFGIVIREKVFDDKNYDKMRFEVKRYDTNFRSNF